MRTALVLILFSIAAFAQEPAAVSTAEAACGPKGVNFDVKDDNSQHTVGHAETGKALVYVIQDIGGAKCIGGCSTTKIALDGSWMGANRNSSYFSFAVDPGEHHLCANWQSHIERLSRILALAHFTAETGQTYYFRTRAFGNGNEILFDLASVDSDQGKFLVADYPMSVSHPKK
jgi:hypothetical protein